MSVREAAIQVLRDAGQPLTAQQMAERMLSRGLWQTEGKTPHATVAARLYTDIKNSGDGSPFVLVGPQTFGLRELGARPSQGKSTRPAKTPATAVVAPAGRDAVRGDYSFKDAAEKVLAQFGDKKAMHYRQITDKALELGWIATAGKTPEATMYAQILTDIRQDRERGKEPRFVQHGRGYVSLSREHVASDGLPEPRVRAKATQQGTRTRPARRVTRKSNYEKLGEFLRSIPAEQMQVAVDFAEIEGILDRALPPFSLRHPAWWANTRSHTSQGSVWLSVGWRVEKVYLKARMAVFRRVGGDPLRAVPRYVNDILEHDGAIRRVHAATLRDWIRFCRRVGWYFQGVVLYERAGLSMEALSESDQAGVEEDYQACKQALSVHRRP